MAKVLVPKKKKEDVSCTHKKGFTVLGILAVILVATSAFSWIGFMTVKQQGGKLPWE